MTTKNYGKHTVTTWESIDELPIDRFTAWNKYMMIDGSLGGTFEQIDTLHLSQLMAILDDKQKAVQQIVNLRELVYGLINRVNYQHYAFACMVHSIDGKEITDYSETGVKNTLEKLNAIGLTNGDVKKKTKITNNRFTRLWSKCSQTSSRVLKNITTGRR